MVSIRGVRLTEEVLADALWRLFSPATRVLYITLTALSDREGYVRGSSSPIHLSHMANITVREAEEGLLSLMTELPEGWVANGVERLVERRQGGLWVSPPGALCRRPRGARAA